MLSLFSFRVRVSLFLKGGSNRERSRLSVLRLSTAPSPLPAGSTSSITSRTDDADAEKKQGRRGRRPLAMPDIIGKDPRWVRTTAWWFADLILSHLHCKSILPWRRGRPYGTPWRSGCDEYAGATIFCDSSSCMTILTFYTSVKISNHANS